MKRKYFNKRTKRKQKGNFRKYAGQRKIFSKRVGGVIGVSVLMENKIITADDLSNTKKEIL